MNNIKVPVLKYFKSYMINYFHLTLRMGSKSK